MKIKSTYIYNPKYADARPYERTNLHVLEFSPTQVQFHIQELNKSMMDYQRCLDLKSWMPDYIPLFIGTYEQCSKACEQLEESRRGFRIRRDMPDNWGKLSMLAATEESPSLPDSEGDVH